LAGDGWLLLGARLKEGRFMRTIRLTFAALLLCALPAPALADFDPRQCERIEDVDVPYDVATDSASVTFSSSRDRIVVRAAEIQAGGRMLNGPLVGPYYGDVRRFLDRARVMANAALPFTGGQATMGAAATQMCMAIVSVAASGAAVERAFPGFVSPVRVKFK
jgi:hypothetical protein